MVNKKENAPWQPWVDTATKVPPPPLPPHTVYPVKVEPAPLSPAPRTVSAPYIAVQRERRLSNPSQPSGPWAMQRSEKETVGWHGKQEQHLSRSYYDDQDYSAWGSDTYSPAQPYDQYSPEQHAHTAPEHMWYGHEQTSDVLPYAKAAPRPYEYSGRSDAPPSRHAGSFSSAVNAPVVLANRWHRSVGDLVSLPGEHPTDPPVPGPARNYGNRTLARRHSSEAAPTDINLCAASNARTQQTENQFTAPYERRKAYSATTLSIPAPPMSPARSREFFVNDSTSVYDSYQARRSYGVMRVRRELIYLSARNHNGVYEDYVVDTPAARRHVHSTSEHVYERCRIAPSEFCVTSPILGRRHTPPIGEEPSPDAFPSGSAPAPAHVQRAPTVDVHSQPTKREDFEPKMASHRVAEEANVQNDVDEFENEGDGQGNESDDGVYFKIPRGVTCIEQVIDQWEVGDGPRCPALKDWTVEMRRKERSIYSQRKKLYEEYQRCGGLEEFYRIYRDMPIGKVYAAVSNRNRRARRENQVVEKGEM